MLKPGHSLTYFRLLFFVIYATVGVSHPYLALYFKEIGLSYQELSLILASTGIVVILFNQIWGYIADVILSKKQVLMLKTLLVAGVYFALRFPRYFWLVFLIHFLWRFTAAPRGQILNSLLFMKLEGQRNFTLIRAYGSLGFIVANVLVGYLANVFGLAVIFPLYSLLSLVFFFMLFPVQEQPSERARSTGFWQVQKFFLKNPVVILFLLMVFFYQLGHSVSTLFLSFFIKNELGGDNIAVGVLFALAAAVEIPLFFFADRLILFAGELRLLLIAILAQIARWLLVFFANSLGDLIYVQLLHCLTFGVFYCCGVSYINKQASEELKASAQTLFGMVFFGFGLLMSYTIGGEIVQQLGLRTLYLITSLSALIPLVILIRLMTIASEPLKQSNVTEI